MLRQLLLVRSRLNGDHSIAVFLLSRFEATLKKCTNYAEETCPLSPISSQQNALFVSHAILGFRAKAERF